MGRIICIDYGAKRCGIAVTDPLQLIATALTVLPPKSLIYFLKQYFKEEVVDEVIVGIAHNDQDGDTDSTAAIRRFIRNFQKVFPDMPLFTVDEAYSSQRASEEIHKMQLSKKARERKGIIDEVAATMLLQEYLECKPPKP